MLSQESAHTSTLAPASDQAAKPGRALWPIVALLALGLGAAIWLGNDYGMSWDELRNANVGAAALRVYSGSTHYFDLPSLPDHGPVYFMLLSAGSRAFAGLDRSWIEADARHLINFLMFLAAVLCFYALSRRVVQPPYDWMATAVFATQPLLFGYGFVGQKDTSFMAGFMATLTLGLVALDRWRVRSLGPDVAPRPFRSSILSEWRNLSRGRRILLALLTLAFASLALDVFVFHGLQTLGERVIEAAYRGAAPEPVQSLFVRFATDAYKTSLPAYLARFEVIFSRLGIFTAGILGLATLTAFSLALPRLGCRIRLSRELIVSPVWLASAVLLGLSICMRQVGVFAGLLVSLESLRVGRCRVIFPLAAYWLVAAVSTLATWPYLWSRPIRNFIISLRLAAEFSHHSTLFRGLTVGSGGLPWDYFPTLTALQLTETAVLLIALGLVFTLVRGLRRQPQSPLIPILLLWVGVPFLLLIGFRTSGYEFRQFLFMLPPLLIIGGVGLEGLGAQLRRRWARAFLFGLAILPGLVGIAQLHPYEYIYFNALAGGVSGADGRFQLDRECLSYREAMAFVNTLAPPGAVVVVPQQTNQVEPFARSDLAIRSLSQGLAGADFILSCTWRDQNDFPTIGFSQAYQIRRGTAVLGEVWKRSGQQ